MMKKMMNDLKIIIYYEFKMKIREMKSMIKKYFTILISRTIIVNLELIRFYNNYIFIGISMIITSITL